MGRRNKVLIYSIILANHGKQLKVICSSKTEKGIYSKFNRLIEDNKSVMFPVNYNNAKHQMINSDYEIVIIKCKSETDKDTTLIRNEYGKFINYSSSDEDWIIIDRASYNIEETFGYMATIHAYNVKHSNGYLQNLYKRTKIINIFSKQFSYIIISSLLIATEI